MKMKLLGRGKGTHDCSALLKRLFPRTPKNKLERYPTRVFLCAYMILNHPEVVFSRKGERESALSAASKDMVDAFERLVDGYTSPVGDPSTPLRRARGSELPSFSELFDVFDARWVAYLEQFVAWKLHDAVGLADSLIRMASKMQLSMLRKVDGDIHSDKVRQNSDLATIVQQVQHDHALLRERVERLSGKSGLQKFEAALQGAREKYDQERRTEGSSRGGGGNEAEGSSSSDSGQPSEGGSSSGSSPNKDSGNGNQRHPRRGSSDEEPSLPGGAKNEAFVWELLCNRNYQMESDLIEEAWTSAVEIRDLELPRAAAVHEAPSPTKALQKQIATIAEKAFWDSVEERLASESGNSAFHVCNMLLEIGADLSSMLPNTASAKIVNAHLKNEAELLKLLQGEQETSNNLNAHGLLQLLQHTSELLRECGSEARNAAAVEAQQKVRADIVRALEQGQRAPLAKAVCRALRLLYAQLKVLRFDLANARIRALSVALTGRNAVQYGRDKFAATHGLGQGQSLEGRLPRTQQWLGETVELLRSLELILEPLKEELQTTARTNVPLAMRSGMGMSRSSASATAAQWPEVQYTSPVAASSWRAALRTGLIRLISSPLPLTKDNVPETLEMDVDRLHGIQNAFQRLVVTSAAMLTLQQVRQQTIQKAELLELRSRFAALLDHPNVNLASLTAELTTMSGMGSDVEPAINNTLINLINREKGGFKALSSGLTKALSICLMAGSSTEAPQTKKAIQATLSKIGSTYLLADVLAVAQDLSVVAGINEAVHGPLYEGML